MLIWQQNAGGVLGAKLRQRSTSEGAILGILGVWFPY